MPISPHPKKRIKLITKKPRNTAKEFTSNARKIRNVGVLLVSNFLGIDLVLIDKKEYNSLNGHKPAIASPTLIDTFKMYESSDYKFHKGKKRPKAYKVPTGKVLVMLRARN